MNDATYPGPDNLAAIRFLELIQPGGPWLISAISNDKTEPITTRALSAVEDLHEFVAEHNGKRNLYYAPNRPAKMIDKKASEDEIDLVEFLHTDVDPRAGEDLQDEFERIRGLAPKEVPEPSFVVFSGGGCQFVWRLKEPTGDKQAAEARNRWLANQYGGDHCCNIAWVLRLPGTINLPNGQKQKKGRVPALARLLDHRAAAYNLDDFGAAETETGDYAAVGVADLDELDLPERIRTAIVEGEDIDNPLKGENSRSEWVWLVVCQMLRRGIPDATILGVITNPRWKISDHVLEQSNPDTYARRQIAKARSVVAVGSVGPIDQQIARVNESYFAALSGGKVRWWRENEDGSLEPMDKSAFQFELATVCYEDDDGKRKSVVSIWMSSTARRYYPQGFVLDPGYGHDGPAYNMWRGFSVEPVEGDWSLMRAHIRDVLAAGDPEADDYIVRWTAWTLQNPATPPRVALVFRGGEGIGKGMFAQALVDLFGIHGLRIQTMSHLTGKFNAHLRHRCLLFADEAVVPGSDGEGALKGLITEPTIPIEAKGIDVVSAENHLHIVMATNNDWAVPAAEDARRFAVFNVAEHQKGNADYFRALAGEGLAAMLHDLLKMDLGDFHPEANRPDTVALREQKEHNLKPKDQFFVGLLEDGVLPGEKCPNSDFTIVNQTHVGNRGIFDYMRTCSPQLRNASPKALGSMLKKFGCEPWKSGSVRGWTFPSLKVAREEWEKRFGGWPWDNEQEEWEHQPRHEQWEPYPPF